MKIFDRNFVVGCRRGASIVLVLAVSACMTTACGRATDPDSEAAGGSQGGNIVNTQAETQQTSEQSMPAETEQIPPVAEPESEKQNTTEGTSEADQKLPAEFLAYIRDASATMLVLDPVEWVEIPSDRASELGLDEDDGPSGFYVYNPDVEEEKLALSADGDISILDWEGGYVQKNVTAEEFADVLSGRGEMNDAIPYQIKVKDGAIVKIEEQYVP